MPQETDSDLAARLATDAGRLLLTVRAELAGAAPEERKAAGDGRSHEWLMAALAEHRPADAVLSEEGKDDPVRLAAERVWIVDPVDGTREFSELERDDWAVHVALWERGELAAGAVALPAQDVTLSTADVPALPPATTSTPRLLVSRTRPPAWIGPLAEQLGAELVPMGSAGAKAMAVVQGRADVYVHAGGQYEWDSAAPVAVAAAAGLHTSRIDGSPLRYNQPDPLLPDLLICRPELSEQLLCLLARGDLRP
ncbi:MAG: 3'(2'),5'-bisphosphate nucleotidase CysQ [Mycobacteriales bacterium]